MTAEARKWPLPPMVHKGLEEREGEVRAEPDFIGGEETPLPPPFVAVEFRSSDHTIVEAVPVAVPELDELGPGPDDEVIRGHAEEGEQGRREEPVEPSFATDPSVSGIPAGLPELGDGDEVADGTPPPPPSPQEEVALLLERLAKEVRDRDTIQLEADPGAPPLEGVLRGMLSGYLTHLSKRPG